MSKKELLVVLLSKWDESHLVIIVDTLVEYWKSILPLLQALLRQPQQIVQSINVHLYIVNYQGLNNLSWETQRQMLQGFRLESEDYLGQAIEMILFENDVIIILNAVFNYNGCPFVGRLFVKSHRYNK